MTGHHQPRPAEIERFDAIIVGARVAGASTAMLLARAGLRVLVVDRAALGSETLSTHALLRPGVVQLHRWGLLDDIVATGAPPVRQTTIHYGDDPVTVDIKARHGIDAFYAPKRTVLDPAIVDAARRAGADMRFGWTATGLLRTHAGRVAGIEARAADGRLTTFTAPITIGADGVRSFVARNVDAPVLWQGAHASALVYAYFAGLDADGYEWRYRPGAGAAVIPTNDGERNVSAIMPSPRFAGAKHDIESAFWTVLGEADPVLAGRVAAGRRMTRFRSFPGLPGCHRQPWGPGWALVGDAGSFMDPIGAHGISTALRDAELLARAVTDARADGIAESEAFGWYQHQRDDLSRQLFDAIDQVASHRWHLDTLRELLMLTSAEMNREAAYLADVDQPATAAA
jgi:2-polyprenyl-6-methoxyphenol hydroxylase-like FAD-dependent oxidoreductase